jgi:isoleucyl-tRNA synthetase
MITQLIEDRDYNVQDRLMREFLRNAKIVEMINQRYHDREHVMFMEGPPFISGSGKTEEGKREPSGLHAGHCLVSEIKSCIMKYLHMKGYRCDMSTGTDNHGLPIENFVSKLLSLTTPSEIRQLGIEKFNEKCKEIILKYETKWDEVYETIGRFVDTQHRYKTMDTNYMESVFWVFKQLWEKGLIYKGWKVLPYSYRLGTALSNFEASQCYQTVTDMTAYVYFPMKEDPTTGFVAWTTTPWTLPCNVALCLNPDGRYVKITDTTGRKYIVHENKKCIDKLKLKIKTIEFCGTGRELSGIEYNPPFSYYNHRVFKTICDPFVEVSDSQQTKQEKSTKKKTETDETHEESKSGTGVVHIACGFGEVDYDVCLKHNIVRLQDIQELCPIDDDGKFTEPISDFKGQIVFDTNNTIIKYLENKKLLVHKENHEHKYQFSERTGEKLINRAMSSYFMDVTKIKDRLIEMNKRVQWTPRHIGEGRFGEWIKDAKDWCISRTRFFGTPIPVWVSDDGQEIMCIGSIEELMEKAHLTERPTDLHPEHINKITITSTTGKVLRRIPEVFDCWFESGSVPYGQIHYPFEGNEHIFDDREYLSDFVCEGIDQTRGWFYTLLVLSTALFNKPAFKHVICTGIVLDKFGKKMSKRNGNYADPVEIIEKYGSDVIRMYLLNSPAVQADNLKFDEENIKIMKQNLIQWQNGIKFFIEHYLTYKKSHSEFNPNMYQNATQIFDKWILLRLNEFTRNMDQTLSSYDVGRGTQYILEFINDFTNWYIKLNRPRMKGNKGNEEWHMSLSVTYHVIINAIKVMTPYTPFTSEYIYQNLKVFDSNQEVSIHMCQYPQPYQYTFDENILNHIKIFKDILTNTRSLRSQSKQTASIRKPVKTLYVAHDNIDFLEFIKMFIDIMKEELNCLNVEIRHSKDYINLRVKVNKQEFAKKYKKYMRDIDTIINQLTQDDMRMMYTHQAECITLKHHDNDITLTLNEIEIIPNVSCSFGDNVMMKMIDNLIIGIDTTMDQEVMNTYVTRQFCRSVQQFRKELGLHPWNTIVVKYDTTEQDIKQLMEMTKSEISDRLKCAVEQYDIQEQMRPKGEKLIELMDMNDKMMSKMMIYIYVMSE